MPFRKRLAWFHITLPEVLKTARQRRGIRPWTVTEQRHPNFTFSGSVQFFKVPNFYLCQIRILKTKQNLLTITILSQESNGILTPKTQELYVFRKKLNYEVWLKSTILYYFSLFHMSGENWMADEPPGHAGRVGIFLIRAPGISLSVCQNHCVKVNFKTEESGWCFPDFNRVKTPSQTLS